MFLRATAAVLAAVAVFTLIALPPARITLSNPEGDGAVPGILHVHTRKSDGQSSPEVIAQAAARAGLRFIVFTDHGDGTRPPDPPVYRSGVLCLDGVEISTNGGHYLALDMPAAPYPLGGDARDVVDDVRRLGGFGIVAHPDSPKPELRWRDWDAPFDGIEFLNLDTSWRVLASQGMRSRGRLAEGLLTYPVRPAETIANLIVDEPEAIARWTTIAKRRQVVGTSGADAHARLAWRDVDQGGRWSIPLPSYESTFRSISIHVRPAQRLSGDPQTDARAILQAIRGGHLYAAVDGLATPSAFAFTASRGADSAEQGDQISAGGELRLQVRSNADDRFTTRIWQDDRVIATRSGGSTELSVAGTPGIYRVDIRTNRSQAVPWIVSNPIYVGAFAKIASATTPPQPASRSAVFFDSAHSAHWYVETDGTSKGTIESATEEGVSALRFRYSLPANGPEQSYVALIADVPQGADGFDRVALSVGADAPMRVSVQFRTTTAGPPDERWRRSIYLDRTDRERVIPFDEFTPAANAMSDPLHPGDVRHLLIVVDRTHTKAGTSGTIWIRRAALERSRD